MARKLATNSTAAVMGIFGLATCLAAALNSDLPAGAGRSIAKSKCIGCHEVSRLTTSGYSRAGWQQVIERMRGLGVDLDGNDEKVLTDYLAMAFPPKNAAAATIVNGRTQVKFTEWTVEPPEAFPHDPLAAADGAIWYTGQHASVLGRINPKTGAIQIYRTKTPNSGPHGLTEDGAGNIWFTANYAAYIGKLDPQSGAISEFKLPEAARDPHTPVFDSAGALWFTVQGANMVGRLLPKRGEIAMIPVRTAHALPYGIAVNSKGVPFFAEFGANRIARIDPKNMEVHEYLLPNSASRPRRIAIDAEDVIWYSDYARGFLGRLDPKTGTTREWPSPGGAESRPYGICVLGDKIWYSESGVQPNTLVLFDPQTQSFQSWVIPAGGGVVRNMMPSRDGSLVLAESGVGKVAQVKVSPAIAPGSAADNSENLARHTLSNAAE